MKANLADAKAVLHALYEAGHQAYLAGGCVRDMILGLEPNDYDVTTSATPQQIQEIFPKTVAVGEAFGVIKVLVEGREIDVATFRIDGQYSDNRRPDSVTYSDSAEEDVKRRDFTINALLMNYEGKIVDYVGGVDDLHRRIIRAVGNPRDRFAEDSLRMMRAIRFSLRFSMDIEEATWDAINLLSNSIKSVSIPRFTEELQKTFSYGNCDRAFWMLVNTGIWSSRLHMPSSPDVFHIMKVMSKLPKGIAFPVPMSIILDILYRSSKEQIISALSLTREEKRSLETLTKKASDIQDFLHAGLAKQRRIMQWPDIDTVNALAIAYHKSGVRTIRLPQGEDYHSLLICQQQIKSLGYPDPIVNGDDLQAMGFIPGPTFTTILEEIHDHYLAGSITEKSQVQPYIELHFPFLPRKDSEGNITDLMRSVRMMAQCKKCGRSMSFEVEHSAAGAMITSSIKDPKGCTRPYGRFTSCLSCGAKRFIRGFVRPVGV